MASKKNYLIGKAEALTSITPPPKMNPQKQQLYSTSQLIERLKPQLVSASNRLLEKAPQTCPKDYSVLKVTLHPSFIAKSFFPTKLFRTMNARTIGSKSTLVLPDKWTKVAEPKLSPSTSIFVAAKRESFFTFGSHLEDMIPKEQINELLEKIWSIEDISVEGKLKPINDDVIHFEVVLTFIPNSDSSFIYRSFIEYAKSLQFEVRDDLTIFTANLAFVPIIGNKSALTELSAFSFIRILRAAPQLRSLPKPMRAFVNALPVTLKQQPPLDTSIKVAILDGGLPTQHSASPWVNQYIKSDPTAPPMPDGDSHGLAVCSAVLFGPLKPSQLATRPFSFINKHRVIDARSQHDPLDLYRVLQDIEDILLSRQYEFINLSLGPEVNVEDDDIHSWTSVIDSYLAEGDVFMTVAAGNNGEEDCTLGLNRVQVPSDLVNAITVGSASTSCAKWDRASYSAIGPGRSPGRIKPDVLEFGGSPDEYFHVLDDTTKPTLIPQLGTSLAAPYLLRKAIGVRALFGNALSPLAIKALMIHSADLKSLQKVNVGWGKVPDDLALLVESREDSARIIYQDTLKPGKYLKVPVPIPTGGINGNITIRATCCITTPVDPQDTSMYTRAGVDITWRPHSQKKTDTFFKQTTPKHEAELRRDAGEWETVLKAERNKRGSSLYQPSFELHYIAREGGASVNSAPEIKYAFIVEIIAPKHANIFNDILDSYVDTLTEVVPKVNVDVTVGV